MALQSPDVLTEALVLEANEYLKTIRETMLERPKMVKNKFGKSSHRTDGEDDFVVD